jgi:hypothetical protein
MEAKRLLTVASAAVFSVYLALSPVVSAAETIDATTTAQPQQVAMASYYQTAAYRWRQHRDIHRHHHHWHRYYWHRYYW